MKIPMSPPDYLGLFKKLTSEPELNFNQLISLISQKILGPVTEKGKYEHWDKLRHLQPPEGFSTEAWWFAIKFARKAIYKTIPFADKYGKPMFFATPDIVLQKLHTIDRKVGNPAPVLNSEMRDSYLVRSFMEEATTSSQLEGASTTRKVAKEMLQTGRKPRDKSEQMIFNNYKAMQFVQEIKDEKITVSSILELHRILTEKTLDDPDTAGKLRGPDDDIHVWDNSDGALLHTPPNSVELKHRLQKLCDFGNATEDDDGFFIHPVVRAILLHFVLAYDHPFVDGNGRTARALFYWSMARQGYSLMGFISISKILKEASSHYARAFLYTETDENDVTYFVLHQLDVILKAIDALYEYLDKKAQERNAAEKLLQVNQALHEKINYRQMALIRHALKHPDAHYQISVHRQSHNISYQTARTDLLVLESLGLLVRRQIGKAFIFVAPEDLKARLEKVK
ncbi:MAG: Fic family protein [Gammaproteobacteria bacterium]|nr:Fic family protein [Gammaproteobacteria bacterium]